MCPRCGGETALVNASYLPAEPGTSIVNGPDAKPVTLKDCHCPTCREVLSTWEIDTETGEIAHGGKMGFEGFVRWARQRAASEALDGSGKVCHGRTPSFRPSPHLEQPPRPSLASSSAWTSPAQSRAGSRARRLTRAPPAAEAL